jgi:hypothetical protein
MLRDICRKYHEQSRFAAELEAFAGWLQDQGHLRQPTRGHLYRVRNERLEQVGRLENELAVARARQPPPITEAERAEILALGSDLPLLWNYPDATVVMRKRILRTLLEEIVVIQDSNRLYLKLHWKGGDHTALEVPRNRAGQHRYKTSDETEKLIVDLARHVPDQTKHQS